MEPWGEAAGIIGVERIVIGRNKSGEGRLWAWEWNGAW